MLSFKQWLLEARFKKAKLNLGRGIVDVEIYKNPSGGDWGKIPDEARGILTVEGDLYLATLSGEYNDSWFVHEDIIAFLANVLPIHNPGSRFPFVNFSKMKLVPVQQYKNTKKFYVSESMSKGITGDKKQQKYALKLFKKGENKNSGIKFFYKSILKAK